jgi:uncharacterized protein (TIGR03435 family)
VALHCASISAQTPPPAFEVAVIKPALPLAEAIPLLKEGKMKIGVRIDKARVDMGFVTLTDLIVEAWKVKPHQISGPNWLSKERFDIQAKLPDGASADQIPQMLQTLLAERFGMKTHPERRTLAAWALVVDKNGPKLKPATLPLDPEPARGLTTMTPSAGGAITASGGPNGQIRMAITPNGAQIAMLQARISAFADMLTTILGKPVVDRTGLNGYYEITLDLTTEDVQNVARALGAGGPTAAAVAPADAGGSSMFHAVEQLGLRLDSRREPIGTLVIDTVKKLPTAN